MAKRVHRVRPTLAQRIALADAVKESFTTLALSDGDFARAVAEQVGYSFDNAQVADTRRAVGVAPTFKKPEPKPKPEPSEFATVELMAVEIDSLAKTVVLAMEQQDRIIVRLGADVGHISSDLGALKKGTKDIASESADGLLAIRQLMANHAQHLVGTDTRADSMRDGMNRAIAKMGDSYREQHQLIEAMNEGMLAMKERIAALESTPKQAPLDLGNDLGLG